MKNPLLKKANGFDTPEGPGKKHYDGYYPEAVGGGWNPMTDNDNLSGEISDQMGGYAPGTRGADKVQGFIDGIYRGTQEPPTKSKEKTPTTGMKFNAGRVASKFATGEMSPSEVTRQNFPMHFAIADAVGGTVEPFDVYQGPYIQTSQGKLFITVEEGGLATVWNESTTNESNAFFYDDEDGAVEAAISVMPEGVKPKAKETQRVVDCDYCNQPYTLDPNSPNIGNGLCSKCSDNSDELITTKKRKAPRFTKQDKEFLHSMGIKGALRSAWDKAVRVGALKFESNRYSFTKEASAPLRAGLKDTVIQVNSSLNRRHIPKNAAAHEAAVKVIAQRVRKENRTLDKMSIVAKVAARATHVVYASDVVRVMRGSTTIEEQTGSWHDASLVAAHIAGEYGVPMAKVKKAASPKCPHCGSTKYALMPTDFETAKCDECGKNWDHGIVEGINDPKMAGSLYRTQYENQQPPRGVELDSHTLPQDDPEAKKRVEQKRCTCSPLKGDQHYECPVHGAVRKDFEKEATEDDDDACAGCGCSKGDHVRFDKGFDEGWGECMMLNCGCKGYTPKAKTASKKTAAVYKVEQLAPPEWNGDKGWFIVGLPQEGPDGKVDPNSYIIPGLYHSLRTAQGLTQGIYEQLYDEFQTNENLKDGDLLDTPVGQFICQGVDVLPHDEKAKANLAKVNEQYKCANCGCDQGDHRVSYDGEFTDYMECRNHPNECKEFKKNGNGY